MSSNPIKRDFSKNQIKILKLLFEKDYLQNELQDALNTTAPNLYYHLSRLERHNLIQKETLHEVGSAKINKISLNPSARETVRKLLEIKKKKSIKSNASKTFKSGYKPPSRVLKKLKNNYYRISIVVLVLSLLGIISLSVLFSIRVPAPMNLTANADIFTQVNQIENVELTADADVFTQKTNISDISVYDGSGATPFLRLGLYEFTYDAGGYLSEIYIRFNLPKIENISSMVLQLTYWSGYPIEVDDYYEVNASLVSNNWIEADTVWTERPEYLDTSTLVYLHNPGLESEVYLNITSLAGGFTEALITIHLCPNNLSRIRFPAPFESSESYGITPRLILDYSTRSKSIIPEGYNSILIALLVFFGILSAVALTGIVYKIRKQKVREVPAIIKLESSMPIIKHESPVGNLKQEEFVPIIKQESPAPIKTIEKDIKIRKSETHSISISEITSGFILSIIGGLGSIALGFWLPEIFPNIALALGESFIVIQGITIIGGIITLIGAAIVSFNTKAGKLIILISGIVAGGNIITIIGAIIIFKKIKQVY